MRIILSLLLLLCVWNGPLGAAEPTVVKFEASPQEATIAERFRLAAHEFPVTTKLNTATSTTEIFEVTFPSPVTTTSEVNNTVHCEFFRAKREGQRPAVVVLHILGGDFALSRLFCSAFASEGTSALFLKMPYYGPRRAPDNPRRMISKEPAETVEGMTQAVLDIRRAVAWLGSREDVAPDRIGVFGISLGGITGALASTAEPRLQNVCLLLAGGDLGQVAWESKELAKLRDEWVAKGRTKDEFLTALKPVDPTAYGQNVRGRRILLLNADKDEVIPKACTVALWKSFGEPPIVWYDGGHYTVIKHLPDALLRASQFFAGPLP